MRTVLGDRNPGRIGFTHCHEHLFVFPMKGVNLQERLVIDDYEKTRQEVRLFAQKGGGAIVDLQPFGAGRHPELLRRLSGETGVCIVAATGMHRAMFYPEDFWSFRAGVTEMAELFRSEIEVGMFGYDYRDPFATRTDIRAGVIKVATDGDAPADYYGKVFEAAARAHRATGATVITHTEMSRSGMEQARFLIDRGVDPECIVLSHMDRVIDRDANLALGRMGVYLEYDTIARLKYHSDEEEARLIETMVEAGHADRILLGMDVTRDRYLSYGGDFGLPYIADRFIPFLRERGVSRETTDMMTVDNPRRALAFRAITPSDG